MTAMSSYRSPYKGTSGIQRILNATRYSLAGFKTAFQNEVAFRQILLINLILIPLSFVMPVVDRISMEQHELSKNAKDMGSAAQFVALSLITVTWVLILAGHLI